MPWPAAEISYTYVQGSEDLLLIQPSVVGAKAAELPAARSILPTEPQPPPTFTFYNTKASYAEAELQCNMAGGHLAYYNDETQQHEVSAACWWAHTCCNS